MRLPTTYAFNARRPNKRRKGKARLPGPLLFVDQHFVTLYGGGELLVRDYLGRNDVYAAACRLFESTGKHEQIMQAKACERTKLKTKVDSAFVGVGTAREITEQIDLFDGRILFCSVLNHGNERANLLVVPDSGLAFNAKQRAVGRTALHRAQLADSGLINLPTFVGILHIGAFFLSLIGENCLCALNGIAVRCAFCLMDRFTQRSARLALDRLNVKRRLLGSIICGTQVQPVANDNAPCMFAKSKRLVQFSGNSYLTFAGNFNDLGFCIHNSLLSHQAPPEKCPVIMRIVRLVFVSVSLCRAHCVKNNRKARKRKTRLQPSRRVIEPSD